MKEILEKIFKQLDKEIIKRESEAREQGFNFRAETQIKLLGQMSLLVNESITTLIELNATRDVDSYIQSEYWVEKKFESLLKKEGLLLDKDRNLIWMPEETIFKTFFTGKYLTVLIPEPIYCLASKAIKAKEKNKQLIIFALLEYGDKLENLIKKYNGELEFFYE